MRVTSKIKAVQYLCVVATIAAGPALTLDTTAFAAPKKRPPTPVAVQCEDVDVTMWPISDIHATDTLGIVEAFSRYAWALDNKSLKQLVAIFDKSSVKKVYSACRGSGTQIFSVTYDDINDAKKNENLIAPLYEQPRHLISNILLMKNSDDPTLVTAKATMLVLSAHYYPPESKKKKKKKIPLSRFSSYEYSADLRATLKNVGGTWTFETLTSHTDLGEFSIEAR